MTQVVYLSNIPVSRFLDIYIYIIYYMKLKSRMYVCLSDHQGLLEMKVVSFETPKYILKNLYVQVSIDMNDKRHGYKLKQPLTTIAFCSVGRAADL